VLKGGFALDRRFGTRARLTYDVDLGRRDTVEEATADLLAAAAVDAGDFFVFRVEKTEELDGLLDGAAARYRVAVDLAGRPFESAVLDVGFGAQQLEAPETLPGSTLLAFAGIHPIEIPTLPLEQHIAEKVHAYTRAYGESRRASTRVKDLVDLVLISTHSTIEPTRLRAALQRTFAERATHPLPKALPRPPTDWQAPYARLATEVGMDGSLALGHADGLP
jgi:hypothetical protein